MEKDLLKKEAESRNQLADKLEKKRLKKKRYLEKMQAAETFGRVFIYLSYQWKTILIALFSSLLVFTIFGILAKIVWTIWVMIFNVSL